jgi:hypothetical protein
MQSRLPEPLSLKPILILFHQVWVVLLVYSLGASPSVLHVLPTASSAHRTDEPAVRLRSSWCVVCQRGLHWPLPKAKLGCVVRGQ